MRTDDDRSALLSKVYYNILIEAKFKKPKYRWQRPPRSMTMLQRGISFSLIEITKNGATKLSVVI